MKNRIQLLLVAALAICATQNSAGSPTNKTFLQPRSQGVNLALTQTAGWSNVINRKAKDAFGGNLQAAFFMSGSTEKDALAKYFLFANKAQVSLTADIAANTVGGTNGDLDLGYIIHNYNRAAAQAATTVKLAPEQKTIGATFNYRQDLKCILNGLYFDIVVPVANVENSMSLTTGGVQAADLTKFFQGTRDNSNDGIDSVNAYVNLNKALISGCSRSETGVADIDMILGYKFLNNKTMHMAVNLGVTVPTGNTPDGKYVFDAIVGNAGHVGFGVGLDSGFNLWTSECKNHSFKLNVAANYRYLFENDETRTLGFTDVNAGQYALLINRTKSPNAQQLTPAANVTTLRVDVTPGSTFDGILAVNYNCHGFAFDLGYNLFYRDTEKVRVCTTGCGSSAAQFADNTWGIATRNADMNDLVNPPLSAATNTAYVLRDLNAADLDVKGAQTPSLLSHKMYGGVGYWTKTWEVPVLVGVGAHYEWADADIISNWGFNAKLGVGF